MLDPKIRDYDRVYRSFRWQIPEMYNIARECCDKPAIVDPNRLALIQEDETGEVQSFTFGRLRDLSNRLANALRGLGVQTMDRVAVILPQGLPAIVTHLAIYKLGAIAAPLSPLLGDDALFYRLQNSGSSIAVFEPRMSSKVTSLVNRLPALRTSIVTGKADNGELEFDELIASASEELTPVATLAEDPAILIYTSGTSGPPKGVLHAQRVLPARFASLCLAQDFFPQKGDLFWTPADWVWIGSWIDSVLTPLAFGVPVVAAARSKFDPEWAYALMAKHRVQNTFMPPTALKMMKQVPQPRSKFDLHLRAIHSGGEPLSGEVVNWVERELGLTVNEIYGQTEAGFVVGNCSSIMPVKLGSMGRPYPGHVVEVVDSMGNILPPHSLGEIAVKHDDPTVFLGYWNDPGASAEKVHGDWLLTGDLATKDEDGYLWFKGRKDEIINSSGYRIGPGEVEDAVLHHPGVAEAVAVGSPDPLRGNIVKAFVKVSPGYEPSDALAREIQEHVKKHLAAYEYPREIEFIDEFPLTATGKINRGELRHREEQRKREQKLDAG